MDDVDIVESAGDGQLFQFRAGGRTDAHEQAVDGVFDQIIAMDLRPNTLVAGRKFIDQLKTRRMEIRFLKTVRIRRQGRIGALRDRVERYGRPHLDHLDRIHDLVDRIDPDNASAIANVGMVDVVQENAFVLVVEAGLGVVQIRAEDDTAPVTGAGRGDRGMRILTDTLVQPGREVHAF